MPDQQAVSVNVNVLLDIHASPAVTCHPDPLLIHATPTNPTVIIWVPGPGQTFEFVDLRILPTKPPQQTISVPYVHPRVVTAVDDGASGAFDYYIQVSQAGKLYDTGNLKVVTGLPYGGRPTIRNT